MENSESTTKIELKKILDLSPDIICTIDIEGQFIVVSKAAFTIWGYSPAELIGKKYMDYVYPEDYQLTIEAAEEIRNGANLTNFENRYVRKDGSVVNMIWSAHWDKDENIMHCIARDGTESQIAENKLLISEKRFKSLVEHGSDLIAILDTEANYKFVSASSFDVLGRNAEDYVNTNALGYVHPDDVELALSYFNKLDNERQVKIPPYRFLHLDGTWRWIETIATNLLDDPAVHGIVCNSRDITANVNGSEALRLSEEKYKLLFQLSPFPK